MAISDVRQSQEYEIAKANIADRQWRLNHLYWIQDKEGDEVLYKHKPAQQQFYDEQHYRDLIVKGRQIGFSTEIAILTLDDLIFRRNTRAAIIDATLGDAKKKLSKIKFAYDRMPPTIRATRNLINANTEHLKFSNNSEISVGTTFRGDTPQILHVSEYGKISQNSPETAKEIKLGAFNAVGKNGKIYVEATAHGNSGEFYDMVQRAMALAASGLPLTNLDFKLHFFPWHVDPEYRLPAHQVILTQDLIDYFRDLKVTHGIEIDAEQMAWYAKMYSDQGPDDMKSEYPSRIGECFAASVQGAYFKREMERARIDKRVGLPMPWDPTRPVNTFWDIGMDDENCIWFHQTDSVRHRLIDFYKNSGEGLAHYVDIINKKREERGFVYGKHYGPHDLEVRDWSAQGAKPRKVIAAELGLKFEVVPRIEDKADAIEAARRFLATTWIDSVHCSEGEKGLDNYRKKWNKTIGAWGSDPVHDFASHIADALMTGACGVVPDRVPRSARRGVHSASSSSGPTHWSS